MSSLTESINAFGTALQVSIDNTNQKIADMSTAISQIPATTLTAAAVAAAIKPVTDDILKQTLAAIAATETRLSAQIAAIVKSSGTTAPVVTTPVVTTPVVTTPATPVASTLPLTAVLTAVTSTGVTVAADSVYAKGQVISFANGRTTTIVGVVTGTTTVLSTSEAPADSAASLAALVGTKATTKGTAATVTTPVVTAPVVTAPVVTVPVAVPSAATINFAGTVIDGITFPAVTGINSRGGKKGELWVNCGMGAGGTSILPGVQGTNYALPTEAEVKRCADIGFTGLRIGFALERVIAKGGASRLLTTSEVSGTRTIDSIIQVLQWCAKYGLKAMLDAHNYGRFSETGSDTGAKPYGITGGPAVDRLGKDWLAILTPIKAVPAAWAALTKIDTMNEPVDQNYAQWKAVAQSVLDTCATFAEDKIFVFEGINFSSTVYWVQNNPDFYTLVHPKGKAFIEFSPHLYLDQGASGYYETLGDTISAQDQANGCTFANIGIKRLTPTANWALQNGVSLVIGEHIVPGTCPNLLTGSIALLTFCIMSGIDVCIFGISDWFGNNQHNLELASNAPTLAAYRAACKLAKAA